MAQYGVTKSGFDLKPFQAILDDKAARAREMFGDDIDLRPTSALRKMLDITSFEDQELWKGMEQLYYGNFVSTASGDALDLLGEDAGLARRFLKARGFVRFKLSNEEPGRVYHLPVGTIVGTDASPSIHFRTLTSASVSREGKEALVEVEAAERGPGGDVAAGAVKRIDPAYAERFLSLGGAVVAVTNEQPLAGGDLLETDEDYRERLLGFPRALWTLERVERAVKEVDGVVDCLVSDPLGGVDVSRHFTSVFQAGGIAPERHLDSPYYFDVVVATYPGTPWETVGGITGVRERVAEAVRDVRPVSILPNLIQANDVEVGVRTTLKVMPGHAPETIRTDFVEEVRRRINGLRLGGDVLYSDVLCIARATPGVRDVQGLHLRRYPSRFGGINFGGGLFRDAPEEAAVGENLSLAPDEIAVFGTDPALVDVEVVEIGES
ncbi:MAG TPA: baseplate J/gp47 family protein [Pyrinomonadaceae bacterium]